ncbi:MAG: hypothetical protein R3C60_04110 [Parvularculaceae bacterium]
MKKERPPINLREPRIELKRPSKRDEDLDDLKKSIGSKSQFGEIRQDKLSRILKK